MSEENGRLARLRQDHSIYDNLRGLECVCGKAKSPGKSFCRADYFRLPIDVRNALYVREGYPETYKRACGILGLQAPEAKEAAAQ